MKLFKIIFAIIIITKLSSCGYNPINKISNNQISINKYTLIGNAEVNKMLQLNFNRFQNNSDTIRNFEITGKSQIIKSIDSKDSAAEITGYNMKITISITVFENEEELTSNKYLKNTNYSNFSSKFELKQYEKILIKDLVNEMISEINYQLMTL